MKHQLRKSKENNNEDTDGILTFYSNLFDNVHLLFIHAIETGIRMIPNKYALDDEKMNEEEEDEIQDDIYFDFEFKRLTEEIERKRKITSTFNRFKSNHKFTIGINNSSNNGMIVQNNVYRDYNHN